MGLDMYLEADLYLPLVDMTLNGEGNLQAQVDKVVKSPIGTAEHVRFRVGYWRKANAIHHWFVQNCADGTDDCREVWVSVESLRKLRDTCEKVLAHPKQAPELLPTTEGFFFGDTEYGEGYKEDLRDTIKILDKILMYETLADGNKKLYNFNYYYRASW